MKFSRLLVLSALGLASLGVNAADLTQREAPEYPGSGVAALTAEELENLDKTPATVTVGKAYVMYNVGAQLAWLAGNSYSTRASIGPWASTEGDVNYYSAAVVYFARTGSAEAQGEGVVELKNWVPKFSEFRSAFGGNSGDGDIWTDNNSRDDRFWTISDQGDNTYRIANFKNDGGKFLGWNGTEDYTLYLLDTDTYGTGVDWQFYEVTEWTGYLEALEVYNKAEDLRTVIENAEKAGVDVSVAADVYNNTDATLAQIEAAIEALRAAMVGGIGSGTADSPTDATSLLLNPNFDNASSAGWSGSSPNMVGSGSHGPANVAEFYQGSNIDMYQELSAMPAGVYRLQMYGLYRSGSADAAYQNFLDNANYRAQLYATVDGDMLTTDIVNPFEIQNKESFAGATDFGTTASESVSNGFRIPNDPSCARVYFDQGWYLNTLFFYVSGSEARVGVREDGTYTSSDWFPFDEFTLTYYGNTQASFQKWVELSAPDYSSALVSADLLSNYQSTVSSLASSAADKAAAAAAVEQIKELVAEMKANQALWAQYQAKVAEALAMGQTPEYADYAADLVDYCEMDAEDHIKNRDLSSDELVSEMAYIDQLISAMREEASSGIAPGKEVTNSWFTNCDFTDTNVGWTYGEGSCNFSYGIAEAYGNNFDIHQDYTPAKKGVYQLDLQGFFRTARNNESLASYLEGTQTCDAGVYIGTDEATNKTYLKCVFAEQISDEDRGTTGGFTPDSGDWSDGNYYANTMEAANKAFEAGMYQNTAYGIVRNEGETLRIGVGGKLGSSDWICWDNFKLTYLGYEDATANAYLIDLAIDDLNSMDLDQPMGKSVKTAVQEAITAGNAAKASGDGSTMFTALSTLYDVKSQVVASITLFAELNDLVEDVFEQMSESTASEAAITAAGDTAAEIQNGMENGEYEDEDVPGLKERLNAALLSLRMPDGMEYATADNPVDATSLILSADYGNEDDGNLNKGWEGDTGNFGNDDTQKGAYAYEFYDKTFDHYQTLNGLPAGTYEVQVYAFNRYGGNAEDYQAVEDGITNTAFLYAETSSGEQTAALPFLTQYRNTIELGVDGEASLMLDASGNVTDDASEAAYTYYMPGSMVSAGSYFEMENYFNTLKVNVGSDGSLRIGIRKTENQGYGWAIMDSWKLFYYGNNGDVEYDKCDFDENGKVNGLDIQTIIMAAVNESTDYDKFDINGDGKINGLDIQEVINVASDAAARLGIVIDED